MAVETLSFLSISLVKDTGIVCSLLVQEPLQPPAAQPLDTGPCEQGGLRDGTTMPGIVNTTQRFHGNWRGSGGAIRRLNVLVKVAQINRHGVRQ